MGGFCLVMELAKWMSSNNVASPSSILKVHSFSVVSFQTTRCGQFRHRVTLLNTKKMPLPPSPKKQQAGALLSATANTEQLGDCWGNNTVHCIVTL